MKKILLIVFYFGVVSIGLTWFWNEWARAGYGYLFSAVASPLYELIGLGDARVIGLRGRYINFVPFVSMVVVTPGLTLRRRAIGLVLGWLFIFACHVALNLTELFQRGSALPIVPAIVSDALPFLVWIVVAYPVLAKFISVASEPKTNAEESPIDE